MTAGEKTDRELLDHGVLPDDHLGELSPEIGIRFAEVIDGGDIVFQESGGGGRVGHGKTAIDEISRTIGAAVEAGKGKIHPSGA
jgi:hypothetical protein